jgi:hypothetical protein
MRFWHDLSTAYERHIFHEGKEQAFWLLVAFLVTFVVTRAITHAIRAGRGPFRDISLGHRHVHHLVPGIILLLVSGYIAAAVLPELRTTRTVNALAFGVGAALTLDEFALWLNLKDVYWEKQGRRSVDAVIIAGVLGALVVLGSSFWIAVGHAVVRLLHD